ncbi:phage tail terminator family protein [Anaerocolumna jejuensis]|uniref:phage tail terminator family protein n=1 Tax=Anaerocolumna jejuensis TaxID=259063 RepID=UPI003F7CC624
MIKVTEIYKAVNARLKTKYNYRTYGQEVAEGYDKPSFFVNLIPKIISNESVFYKRFAYTISITYFSDKTGEVKTIDSLKKIDEIQELFGNNLKIKEGVSINLSDYSYDFVGNDADILQISIDTEFYDKIPAVDENDIAGQININNKLKG